MARIYGERIMLREYQKEDFAGIRKWVNDPEVTEHLSDIFLFPHTAGETEKFLNGILDGSSPIKGFVIADRRTEAYLGQIDLVKIDWKNRVGTLGIVIGAPENRGRGIGTEAIGLMLEFAFQRLNLHRIELEARDYNTRALRCYRKCGFQEEGRARQNSFIRGRYTDTVRLGILKEEYLQQKKA